MEVPKTTVLCQVNTNYSHLGKENIKLRESLHQTGFISKSVGHFILVDICGRAQPTLGGFMTELVVWGGIRKQIAQDSKQCSSVACSCLGILPMVMDCDKEEKGR